MVKKKDEKCPCGILLKDEDKYPPLVQFVVDSNGKTIYARCIHGKVTIDERKPEDKKMDKTSDKNPKEPVKVETEKQETKTEKVKEVKV